MCKTRDSSVVFFVIIFQLVEENNDNTTKENDVEEGSLHEIGQDISNLTPKSGARWASLKSPTSFLTKSKK